jgi:hypothetical protein
MTTKFAKALVLVGHALLGWAWCGALIGIGRKFLPLQTVLVVHAIAGPLGVGLLSALYTRFFAVTTPLVTASVFLGLVVALDSLLVAPFFEHSYVMFASVLGTWLPFALIFLFTYLGAKWAQGRRASTVSRLAG